MLKEIKTGTSHYFQDEFGRAQGLGTEYHGNGEIFYLEHLVDDVRHGPYYSFHYNGKPHVATNFVNGMSVGEFKKWNVSGMLVTHEYRITPSRFLLSYHDGKSVNMLYMSDEEKMLLVLKYGLPLLEKK